MLKSINDEKKRLTTLKESMTKPLNETLKNIRGLFAPVEDKIASAEGWVKGKMLDWNKKVTEENRKKEAEIIAKVDSGEMKMETAGNKLEKLEDKKDAIPTRKQKVVIVDDESKIPHKYWVVDMVMVRREALAGVAIEGVRVEEQEIIVSPR